jgi:hypothetical protein
MEKIRFILRNGLDGATLAAAPTDFALVEGWTQGSLTASPVGILPAGCGARCRPAIPTSRISTCSRPAARAG